MYSVPQAIVIRAWAEDASASVTSRRLLIRNSEPQASISFRITLPTHTAIRVSGPCIKRAAFDSISSVHLAPGGTEALTVEFLHDEARADNRAEIVDELLLRTHRETIHVPLVALRNTRVPQGGEPGERRSPPSTTEHWDEDDSDDDDRPICSSHGRPPRSRGGPSSGSARPHSSLEQRLVSGERVRLTPAGCTEEGELDFYQAFLRDDAKARAAAAASASCSEASDASALRPAPVAPAAPPPAPPAPRMRLVQLDADAMRGAGGAVDGGHGAHSAEREREGGDGEAVEETLDEEAAFYRSFVAAKRQAERAEHAERAGGESARVDGCPAAARRPPRVPPSQAQLDARKALAEGTFFVLCGMVSDSRGRELGPVAEVLGAEYADEADEAEHADGAYADGGEWAFADHASTGRRRGDPASARQVAEGLGALEKAGLSALRNALDVSDEGGGTGRVELERQPWRPTGPGPAADLGVSTKGGTVKGGGYVVRSAAPKPVVKLSAQAMEDNWARLS